MARRRGPGNLGLIAGVSALAVGLGLGSSRRLTYHEAIVAQGAREMLATGDWLVPTIGGVPWLEKPPLAHWLVAAAGAGIGRIDEWVARLPSALAAVVLALTVTFLSGAWFGRRAGFLAGLSQATMTWAVTRGRLAEADILLAALVAGLMLSFDRLRWRTTRGESPGAWRGAFFVLLGVTSLAKGIGFGAVLAMSAVVALLIWDRDARLVRRLCWVPGWGLAALIGLSWPLAVSRRFPEAPGLWLGHVTDRLAERPTTFAGEPTWAFLLAPLVLTLPWTPWALVGVRRSIGRAVGRHGRFGPDRLFWAWALMPLVLLSLATVKNDHYLIHALPPWSVLAARGWMRLGACLRRGRFGRGAAWPVMKKPGRGLALPVCCTVALGWGLGYCLFGPQFDDRGREWGWYSEAESHRRSGEPLVLLYDWDGPEPMDRLPYPTPFGPVPHDLAVRLFYLGDSSAGDTRWHSGVGSIRALEDRSLLIGRDRDVAGLSRHGRVEILGRSPDTGRMDRQYVIMKIAKVQQSIAANVE